MVDYSKKLEYEKKIGKLQRIIALCDADTENYSELLDRAKTIRRSAVESLMRLEAEYKDDVVEVKM